MQIVKQNFQVKAVGRCLTKADVSQLLKIGYDKERAIKRYQKDSKIKIEEARKVVEQVLVEELAEFNTKD